MPLRPCDPTLWSAPGQAGSTPSLSWKPWGLISLQRLLNEQRTARNICIYSTCLTWLLCTLLMPAITPHLGSAAGSLHRTAGFTAQRSRIWGHPQFWGGNSQM